MSDVWDEWILDRIDDTRTMIDGFHLNREQAIKRDRWDLIPFIDEAIGAYKAKEEGLRKYLGDATFEAAALSRFAEATKSLERLTGALSDGR